MVLSLSIFLLVTCLLDKMEVLHGVTFICILGAINSLSFAFPTPTRNFTHMTPLTPGSDRYVLFWTPEKDFVTFEVHARTLGYVGFGISATGGMNNADIAIGWVKDGRVTLQVYILET